jgi:hypothetical protein
MHRFAKPIPFGPLTADLTVVASACALVGWAFVESTGGAVAALDIVDGANTTTGQSIVPVTLTAGESTRDFPPAGAVAENGLTVSVTAGEVRGAVWVVLVHRGEDGLLRVRGDWA